MESIPIEIYVQIFSYLPGVYLCISKLVSKHWNDIISTYLNQKLVDQQLCPSIMHKYLEELTIEDDEKILSMIINKIPELHDWIHACAVHYGSKKITSLFNDSTSGSITEVVKINHDQIENVTVSILHHAAMTGNLQKLKSLASTYHIPISDSMILYFVKSHWTLILSNCYLDMIKFIYETSDIVFNGYRHSFYPSDKWSDAIAWYQEKDILHLLVPSIAAMGDRNLIKLLTEHRSNNDLILSGLLHSKNLPLVQDFCSTLNLDSFQYRCICIPFVNEDFPVIEWIYPFLRNDSKELIMTCLLHIGEINDPSFVYWLLIQNPEIEMITLRKIVNRCIKTAAWPEIFKFMEEKFMDEKKYRNLSLVYMLNKFHPFFLFIFDKINWNQTTLDDIVALDHIIKNKRLFAHLFQPNLSNFIKSIRKSYHDFYQKMPNNYDSVTFSDGTKIRYLKARDSQIEEYLNQMVQYEEKRQNILIKVLIGIVIVMVWFLYYLFF